jgi:hypothetical protein
MYGQYSRSLGDYAKEQAAQLRRLEKKEITGAKIQRKELQTHTASASHVSFVYSSLYGAERSQRLEKIGLSSLYSE